MVDIGKMLGPTGINTRQLKLDYDAATAAQRGAVVPVVVTVFEDRSFTLRYKAPPTAYLIRKVLGLAIGELHVVEVVGHLRELTARLINSEDLDQALGSLVETTARAVPGEAWCGMTLIREGAPTTAAVSEKLPPEVDELHEPGVDGPCLTAIRTREMIISQDLTTESRWPDWCSRACCGGIRAAMSVPLDIDDQVVGALTLYAREPASFST